MTKFRTPAISATQSSTAVLEAPSAGEGYEGIRSVLLSGLGKVGPSQLVPLGAALLFAIGCTLWAIQEGVSVPVALMGGYCTIVAGIILCAVQIVLAHLATLQAERPAAVQVQRKPNYDAWKLVKTLSVSNASRLWCDIEPGHPYTQESMAWSAAIMDAIKSGALPIIPKPHATEEMTARERANPGWNTEVTREALQAWAKAHGHCPAFLQD
jgi:hypothetical protein